MADKKAVDAPDEEREEFLKLEIEKLNLAIASEKSKYRQNQATRRENERKFQKNFTKLNDYSQESYAHKSNIRSINTQLLRSSESYKQSLRGLRAQELQYGSGGGHTSSFLGPSRSPRPRINESINRFNLR